jgi:hypothetical protein
MDLKSMSFVMACNSFFGRGNKTLQEFNAELKALTPKDRADLANDFKAIGILVTDVPQLVQQQPTQQ